MTIPILFLLASLGVVNGLLVSGYLLIRRQSTIADRYFGGLLLTLCIRIGKSIFLYFNRDTDLFILQVGLSACIFIGPCFYLYIKSLRSADQNYQRQDTLMLLTLSVIIILVGIIFPYRTYPAIWNGYIIYGIYMLWLFFLILGLVNYTKLIAEPHYNKSNNRQYLLAIAVAMCFITLTYQTALFIGFTYIWGSVIFTLTFYYLAGRMLMTNKPLTPRYTSPLLSNASELLQKLDQLMIEEKPFTSKGLKLEELAQKAGMSRHSLSRLLNETYQHGFAHYIRTHRVNEAKQLIHSRPELSLEGVGYEAGFNSKSTFFEAFRNIENCTPSEYKKRKDSSLKLQSTPE